MPAHNRLETNMKSKFSSLTLVVSLFLFSFNVFGFSSRPIPTFPMVCRGGGDMGLIITPRNSGTRFEIRYRKGAQGYNFDRSSLEPGQCTWTDRRISRNEPGLLWWNGDNVKVWAEFRAVGSGYTNTGVVSSTFTSEQAYATSFLNIVRSANYFTLEVYNSGNGYFTIVSISEGS